MDRKKPKCGNRIYINHEVPANAEIKIHEGRECYMSGIDENYRIIKYLDTGEFKRFKITN